MNSGGTYIRIWLFLGMVLLNSFTTLYSQETAPPTPKQLDSLYQYHRNSDIDSLPLSERLQNITWFLEGAKQWQVDSLTCKGLMMKTWLFGKQKQYDSAIAYTQQLYDLAKANRDTGYIKKALKKLGIYYKRNHQLKEAFQYYNENFKIARINNDSIGAGNNLLYMANIQDMLGDYSGSKITAIEGLRFVEETSDLRCIGGLFHIISVSNLEQKKYKEAFTYNEKAVNLGKDSVLIQQIEAINILIFKNTRGLILAEQGYYKESISIFKSLLTNPTLQQNKMEYARVLANLGYVQWLQDSKNVKSESLLLEALRMREIENDVRGLIASNIHLTKYYLDKDTTKALQHAEAAYHNAKKRNSQKAILEALGFVFQLKEDVQQEAQMFHQIYLELQEINQSNREIYAVTRYENDKLTQQNTVLQTAKAKSQTWALGITAVLIVCIIGLGYYYYTQRIYKRRFLQLVSTRDSTTTTPKNNQNASSRDKWDQPRDVAAITGTATAI